MRRLTEAELERVTRRAEGRWAAEGGELEREFSSKRNFLAYCRAEAQGMVRPVGKSTAVEARTRDLSNYTFDKESAFAKWEADPRLQEEFSSAENYVAYEKAMAAGKVKIFGNRRRASTPSDSAVEPTQRRAAVDNQDQSRSREWQRQRWEKSFALQKAFPDFEAFYARCVQPTAGAL